MLEHLPQLEADRLIAVAKRAEDERPVTFPDLAGRAAAPLVSIDGRDTFLLDVSRGRIDLRKLTNQLRNRQVVVLVRLDVHGAPHRNPDDQEIPSPHLHMYREGWGDKWAAPLPAGRFVDLDDPWRTLMDFMAYCSIVKAPNFTRGLFQ